MNKRSHYQATVQIRVLASYLVKLAKRDRERRLKAAKTGITLLQHNVIRLLAEKSCTMSELAQTMFMEPSSLMPIIDQLEKKRLLARTVDSKDRRRTPLVLDQERAKSILAVPLVDQGDALVVALNRLGEKRGRDLLGLLRDVVASMAKNPKLMDEVSRMTS